MDPQKDISEYWDDGETSVHLSPFWKWTPEKWGGIGWTYETEGRKTLKDLSDPFLCVCYSVKSQASVEPKHRAPREERGYILGFVLANKEEGDRDDFTHPSVYDSAPDKWRFSVRVLKAYRYIPEHWLNAYEFFSSKEGRSVARRGKDITGHPSLSKLQELDYYETEVYSNPTKFPQPLPPPSPSTPAGMVRGGPIRGTGYEVSGDLENRPCDLYILRLAGDASAFLGYPARGSSIYKIGFSYSPRTRLSAFRKAMPEGAFEWKMYCSTRKDKHALYKNPHIAQVGEYAMKKYLAENAKHLSGEFYLATRIHIDKAWEIGRKEALRSARAQKR